jgi:Protein of unknown function (DUF3754)
MTVAHHHAGDGIDEFIPVRKHDIVEALLKSGGLDGEDCEKFRLLCRMLEAIYHYEYFGVLRRLRHDYYYFGPEVEPHAAMDRDTVERGYADLVRSLDRVLKDANFVEVPHDQIAAAHRRRMLLRVEVKAPLDDFREIRFYRRGRHFEQFQVREWFGLRARKVEAEVYDDVVLVVAMKSQAEIGSKRELQALQRRKIRPGAVLLKYFRDIAASDLNALFPNVRVVMSDLDKLVLGVPALIGGIPILLNIYATISVLFLVVGFYLGRTAVIHDNDMKAALAALSGLAALGAFIARQWVRYQRQSLLYRTELADNVYFRNMNNNAGIFDYLVGRAEEQECKEAYLAYHFVHTAPSPPSAEELDSRVEAWLRETFGADLDFKVEDALAKLERLGLLGRDGERLFVSPLDGATAQLQAAWNRLFVGENPVATIR